MSTPLGLTTPSQEAVSGGVGMIGLAIFGLVQFYGFKVDVEINRQSLLLVKKVLFRTKEENIDLSRVGSIEQTPFTLSLKIVLKDGHSVIIPSNIFKIRGQIREEFPEGRSPVLGRFRDIFLLKYELQRRCGFPVKD